MNCSKHLFLLSQTYIMKHFFVLLLVASFFACSDGDFDIPSFEFSETVSTCGSYVLYRTNTDKTEALILTLTPNQLTTVTGEKNYNISAETALVYRLFDNAVGTTYFCQDIPPIEPKVLKELNATEGSITVNTTVDASSGNPVYTHIISITNMLFINNKERIFFESFAFGTVTN